MDTSTIMSPNGAPSAMVLIEGGSGNTVHDMGILGNARQNGFGLQWGSVYSAITERSITQGAAFPSGFLFHVSNNGSAHDLKITDVFQNAVAASSSDGVTAARVQVILTEPLRQYVQWMFEWADANGGGCTDCFVTSAYATAGFETFRSKNVQFIRPVGVNASMSMNAAGGWLVQDAKLTFTNKSQFDEESFSHFNPIVNVNDNIHDSSYLNLGGTINNIVILQQGTINSTGDELSGINIDAPNPNITVNGTSYTAPNWTPGMGSGPVGLNSTGMNTRLNNFAVLNPSGGLARPQPGRANISIKPGTGGSLTNCRAAVIFRP